MHTLRTELLTQSKISHSQHLGIALLYPTATGLLNTQSCVLIVLCYIYLHSPCGIFTPKMPAFPSFLKSSRIGNSPAASHSSTWGFISLSII